MSPSDSATPAVLSPDLWLEQYYQGEFFSGKFEHLLKFVLKNRLDHISAKIITIGGTNGKGETARILCQLLGKNKKSFALWTSPHLLSVTERFVLNGIDCDSLRLINIFKQTQSICEEQSIQLSYFEFLYISFLIFIQNEKLDFIVLEVGLGGRLDAVNTLKADICIITSIARDHQELLGTTYKKILFEKLGILNSKTRLFTAFETQYLRQLTAEYLNKRFSSARPVWRELFLKSSCSANHAGPYLKRSDHFSHRNFVMASVVAVDLLGPEDIILNVDNPQQFAMRREVFVRGTVFMLFPSHNLDGFRKLVHFLSEAKYNKFNDIIISFSEREISELSAMIKIISRHYPEIKIYLYEFTHYKALTSEIINKLCREFNLRTINDENFDKFIHTAKSKKLDCPHVLVTGSNYFLGHILKTSLSICE